MLKYKNYQILTAIITIFTIIFSLVMIFCQNNISGNYKLMPVILFSFIYVLSIIEGVTYKTSIIPKLCVLTIGSFVIILISIVGFDNKDITLEQLTCIFVLILSSILLGIDLFRLSKKETDNSNKGRTISEGFISKKQDYIFKISVVISVLSSGILCIILRDEGFFKMLIIPIVFTILMSSLIMSLKTIIDNKFLKNFMKNLNLEELVSYYNKIDKEILHFETLNVINIKMAILTHNVYSNIAYQFEVQIKEPENKEYMELYNIYILYMLLFDEKKFNQVYEKIERDKNVTRKIKRLKKINYLIFHGSDEELNQYLRYDTNNKFNNINSILILMYHYANDMDKYLYYKEIFENNFLSTIENYRGLCYNTRGE